MVDALTGGNGNREPLEEIALGKGQWTALEQTELPMNGSTGAIPPSFCTYLTRILIHNDSGVADWWSSLEVKYSLLDSNQKQAMLSQSFGSLARTVERSLERLVAMSANPNEAYDKLWNIMMERYGNTDCTVQQIAILFALLPADAQPVSRLRQVVKQSIRYEDALSSSENVYSFSSVLRSDYSLLPTEYKCVQLQGTPYFTIYPAVPLFDVGIQGEFGKTAIASPFGPLSTMPLIREQPVYSPSIYGLLGVAGAAGCSFTHSVVIPLDVVKTKNQVDPNVYSDFLGSATRIFQEEGIQGFLLGAQATLVGYLWYGLSVYPSYTFFKRILTVNHFLPPDLIALHGNDIALIAGALAAVVASLGLTPLEAARIRVVADPDTYRPKGLTGTLSAIANEDKSGAGWKALYVGLPPLLTRQIIFGSVKFFAFEKACEAIYSNWPSLRDATWTALCVTLVAGGLSGIISSIVSQPADSVLTYVAQSEGSSAKVSVLEGCRIMIEKEGIRSLFRGLFSRCVWAGSIIAGQFLLYDVFRRSFGVSVDDLSQVYTVDMPDV